MHYNQLPKSTKVGLFDSEELISTALTEILGKDSIFTHRGEIGGAIGFVGKAWFCTRYPETEELPKPLTPTEMAQQLVKLGDGSLYYLPYNKPAQRMVLISAAAINGRPVIIASAMLRVIKK